MTQLLTFDAHALTDVRCELGESPIWSPQRRELMWLDIAARVLHRHHVPSGETRSTGLDSEVTAIGLASKGELIAATHAGFGWVDPDRGTVRQQGTAVISHPAGRMNDGAVGPDGAFWAGSKLPPEDAVDGGLWRLDPVEGTTRRVIYGATISNGLDWFADDSSTMLYIDSVTGGVDRLTMARNGQVADRTRIVDIDRGLGEPDGLTIDEEGQAWIAIWGGARVCRYNRNGVLTAVVRTPAAQTSSCCFGGADGRTLFITSAWEGLDAPGPSDGRLFTCRLPVGGQEPRVFGQP